MTVYFSNEINHIRWKSVTWYKIRVQILAQCMVAKEGLYFALQFDEEGDAWESFHPQRVAQIGVTAHLKQTYAGKILI